MKTKLTCYVRHECSEMSCFMTGNNMLQDITSRRNYQLRIDLEDFQGETRHAVYSNFAVASESDKFRLTLGSYRGNAGNASLSYR